VTGVQTCALPICNINFVIDVVPEMKTKGRQVKLYFNLWSRCRPI
jgi:hypothetical protein